MRVGSLFSGGGLGDLGFVMAGCEIVFQVEIDEYCQKILNLRYPDAKKFRDIRAVKGTDLPEGDILTGGFPCQDLSQANCNGKGLDGPKSGLFFEYKRLICEIKPRWVVMENVSALIIRGMDRLLRELASIGYDAEWDTFPSSIFGAPHQRDRVWVVAYPMLSRKRNSKTIFAGRRDLADDFQLNSISNWIGIQINRESKETICKAYNSPKLLRVDDGTTTELERLKLLGNGQVPYCTKWIAEQIIKYESERTP